MDENWRLQQGQFSHALAQDLVWLCTLNPYNTAVETLARIGKRNIAKTELWWLTRKFGAALVSEHKQVAEHVAPERIRLPGPDYDDLGQKGVSMDGGRVHILDEGWKEFKVGAIYDVSLRGEKDPHTAEIVDMATAKNIDYVSILGSVNEFAPELWRLGLHAVASPPCARRFCCSVHNLSSKPCRSTCP